MHGNPSSRVRELCASALATLAGLSARHRVKLLRGNALPVLLAQLDDPSAVLVSNCLAALLGMAAEPRAANALVARGFDRRLADMSGALDGRVYHPRLRDQARRHRLLAFSAYRRHPLCAPQ